MAQIVQYEAPQAEFDFQAKTAGINQIQQATEQRRRVAMQESEIMHQTGNEIKGGLEKLGEGVKDYMKVNNKANEHAEMLATMKTISETETGGEQKSQQEIRSAPLLDTEAPYKIRQKRLDEFDAAIAGATSYGAKKYAQEKRDAYAARSLVEANAQANDRSIAAFKGTMEDLVSNKAAAIEKNPNMVFEAIANSKNELRTAAASLPHLSSEAAIKASEDTAPHINKQYAVAAIHGYGNHDTGNPEQALEHLRDGTWDKSLIPALGPDGVREMDDYLRREIDAKHTKGQAQISEQKRVGEAQDSKFMDRQAQIYAENGGNVTPAMVTEINDYTAKPYEKGGAFDNEKLREKQEEYKKIMNAKAAGWHKDQGKLNELYHLVNVSPDDPKLTDEALRDQIGISIDISDKENIIKERDNTRSDPVLRASMTNTDSLLASAFNIQHQDAVGHALGATIGENAGWTHAKEFLTSQVQTWRRAKLTNEQIEHNLSTESEWFKKTFWPKVKGWQTTAGLTPQDLPDFTDDGSPASQAASAASGGPAPTPKDKTMPTDRAAALAERARQIREGKTSGGQQ